MAFTPAGGGGSYGGWRGGSVNMEAPKHMADSNGYQWNGSGWVLPPNITPNTGQTSPSGPAPNPFASQFTQALQGLTSQGSPSTVMQPYAPNGGQTGNPASSFPSYAGGSPQGASGTPSPYTPPDLSSYTAQLPPAPALPATINPSSGPSQQQLGAADDAAYARSKDEAANTASAALTGLQGELQARGMGGAGYEAGQIGSTVSREANTIGEASRQNAQMHYDQALARANQADQLAVTQRGQDIGANTTYRGQTLSALDALRGQDVSSGVAQRGQDISSSNERRGQDIGAADARYSTDASNTTARRGQDIGANTTLTTQQNSIQEQRRAQALQMLYSLYQHGGSTGSSMPSFY